MTPTIEKVPEWQRQRCALLQAACEFIRNALTPEGGSLSKRAAYSQAAARWNGQLLTNGRGGPKTLRLSAGKHGGTMRRLFEQWRANGECQEAFLCDYQGNAERALPQELIFEFQKRFTTTGTGKKFGKEIYRNLQDEWKSGAAIPGLGTWQQWWRAHHPSLPLPAHAPRLPVSYEALQRYAPAKAVQDLAAKGQAAARNHLGRMTRDSSALRYAEAVTADDKQIDTIVLDNYGGQLRAVRPWLYFLMEIGSRFIVDVVARGERVTQKDVDALVAHGLATLGIPRDYPMILLFERGTVACTLAKQTVLEQLFPGRLYVHRTGMQGGRAYPAAFLDTAVGKPCSKGMIEAFMYKLDIRLSRLIGATGNKYQNQPASLDDRTAKALDLAAIAQHTGAKLKLPLLTMIQFMEIVHSVVDEYNHDPRHNMQGFHRRLIGETAPGVWADMPDTDISPALLSTLSQIKGPAHVN